MVVFLEFRDDIFNTLIIPTDWIYLVLKGKLHYS